MSDNDVNAPLKPASQTSYAKLFAASAVVGPFLVIALMWLANRVLPVEDAQAFKAPLMAVWGIVASGSGISTLIGGLLRTSGKVSTQKAIAVASAVAQGQSVKDVLLSQGAEYLRGVPDAPEPEIEDGGEDWTEDSTASVKP